MSQLDKLLIRGIRSFDPQEASVIEFYTPLTLIVGHNGAGKTTIIECLKYATTGDMPPNSKNGAFIHDPKVANETEVKAQIKLKFTSVSGKDMTCTRSVSLTAKKNAAASTMKTLESLLVTKNELGEQVSLSSKCAELDIAIPEQLGVSRAILENVIFCHQEDSFWPLSEPSVLKKKFDDIFASTRYTKALESIRSLRKDQASQIKLDENELTHLTSDKARADQVARDLTGIEAKINTAAARKHVLEREEIPAVSSSIRNLEKEQMVVVRLQGEIQSLEMKRGLLQSGIDEIKRTIKVLDDSDEQLRDRLARHQKSLDQQDGELATLLRQSDRFQNEIAGVEKQISTLLTRLGQLQAEKEANLRKQEDRNRLVGEIARTCNMQGFSLPLDDNAIRRFASQLGKDLESQILVAETVKAEAKAEEFVVIDRLQKARGDVSAKEESRKLVRRQIEGNRTKIVDLTKQVQDIRVNQAEIDDLQAKISEEEAWIARCKTTFKPAESEARLKSLNQELQSQEFNLGLLTDELTGLNMQSDTRARLGLKSAECKRKEDSFKNSFDLFSGTYTRTLMKQPDLKTMAQEIASEIRGKERSIESTSSRLDQQKKLVSGLETKISMSKTSLATKIKELEAKMRQIEPLLVNGDFQTSMDTAEKEYEDELMSEKTYGSAENMFRKYLRMFEREKCCPLCTRPFAQRNQEVEFTEKLKATINRIPTKDELAVSLQEKANRRKQYQDMKPVCSDTIRLRETEIPELRQKIAVFERERDDAVAVTDDIEAKIAALKAELSAIQDLKVKSDELIRQSQEVSILQKEIKQLENEISISGSSRSVQELQRDQETAQAKCKSLRRDIDRLNTELRTKQRELQMHEGFALEAKAQMQQANFQLQERDRLERAISDLRSDNDRHARELESIDSSMGKLQETVTRISSELESLRQKNAASEAAISKTISQLRNHSTQFDNAQKEIKRYLDAGGDRQFTECTRNMDQLRERQRQLQQDLKEVMDRQSAIQKSQSEVSVLKRALQDNIKLRESIKDVQVVQREIDGLKRDLSTYDTSSIQAQQQRLLPKYEKLCEELAGLSGEVKQMEEQAKRLRRDLVKDYKDIEERHRNQVIKLKTELLANQDMEKYSKALENAIMKYHSMKMDEINKIIRELWVNTYKGNDIETIEIRSDNENSRAGRSYNYRVVMIKEQTELDMRGRCSAGQKVLTSLIIRLALAESFCLNCGILALDEPTTNLDRDNIESLAESLTEIIKLRRAQKNFQLIIITHDEEFMRLLGQSEYADYYWRVSKNHNQHSIIERQRISAV